MISSETLTLLGWNNSSSGMILFITPPAPSIPKFNGVTSIKIISLFLSEVSPPMIPPRTAAP
jgi:hypothetical protein